MDKKFVEGLFVKRHEKAPEFVIASLSFDKRFVAYLNENLNKAGYLNLDIKRSKAGKLYADLNSWEKEEVVKPDYPKEINSEDIPF